MKVLVITYYWPPSGGSGVQRWLKFVKYFRDFDIEPVVYTVENANYAITDKSLATEIPNTIKIIKQPIWEPNSLFGKSSKKTSAGFLSSKPSLLGKLVQYIRANYFIPDARKFWIKPSVRYLSNYLQEHPVDVLITTGPPHSIHLIGLALKEKLGIKWLADFRDPWTAIDYFHQLPLTKRSLEKHRYLEQQVLTKSDAVVVVGKTMAGNYSQYNENIHVVTNGYDSIISDEAVKLDDKFSLVHVGLMNADRNHQILWQVLKELCEADHQFAKDLQIKLIGKLAKEIRQSIKDYKLDEYTEFVDYLEHEQVLQYQKSAQVLLLSVNNVPSAKGIITGKIFEYLQAKRPILALAPKDGDLAEILEETDAGKVVGFEDTQELKNIILHCYKAYNAKSLHVNAKNIVKYHRKSLTKNLANIIKHM